MTSVPMHDWIALIIGLSGLITAFVARSNSLPGPIKNYIARLGGQKSIDFVVVEATKLLGATDVERQAEALRLLQDVARKKLGWMIPDSIANYIIEHLWLVTKIKQRGK